MADTIEERVAKIEKFIWGNSNADAYFKENMPPEEFDKYALEFEPEMVEAIK